MKNFNKNWHSLSMADIVERLDVDINFGIFEKDVLGRISKYGSNELVKDKRTTNLKIFLGQFKSPLIYILVIAFIVTILLSDYLDAAVIAFSISLNTVLGFFQERKASNVLNLLRETAMPIATVMRDGMPKEVSASKIVVGDIVLLKEGDRVPADIRFFSEDNLKVDESMLTGEFWPIDKSVKILPEEASIFERVNMAFLGSAVVEGRARGIVVSVGEKTEFGKISRQISEIKEEETPLQIKIKKLSYVLAVFIGFIVLAVFVIGVFLGQNIFDMFLTSVALAVAAIPEGLPIGISIALAIGMQKILKNKGLIRKLNSFKKFWFKDYIDIKSFCSSSIDHKLFWRVYIP